MTTWLRLLSVMFDTPHAESTTEIHRNHSKGSIPWNIVFLNAQGDMVVARDPMGFRPLSWAFDGSLFAAAIEDVALANAGFKNVHTLGPGELVHVREDRPPEGVGVAENEKTGHGVLEWGYFAHVASTLDHSSVYSARP